MPKAIFISGATGFVGKNLLPYLSELSMNVCPLKLRNGFTRETINQADIIIHLAGKAHDVRNSSDPEEYDRINFELTKKLYQVFLASGATKFIFMSSVKAVADHSDMPLTEDTVASPVTPYGISKRKAEQYIESQQLPAGKAFYILRPCMIHGPGNKGNFNLLYQFIAKGFPYPLGGFANRRSFLNVQNLCFVIGELIKRDIPSGTYHIADDESLSTNEVITVIGRSLGRDPRIWTINRSFVIKAAKLGDILRLPFNSARLQKLTDNFEVSNKKLMTNLQQTLPFTVREGIARTVEWLKRP